MSLFCSDAIGKVGNMSTAGPYGWGRYGFVDGQEGKMTDLLGILGYVSVLLVFAWVVCTVIDAVRGRR